MKERKREIEKGGERESEIEKKKKYCGSKKQEKERDKTAQKNVLRKCKNSYAKFLNYKGQCPTMQWTRWDWRHSSCCMPSGWRDPATESESQPPLLSWISRFSALPTAEFEHKPGVTQIILTTFKTWLKLPAVLREDSSTRFKRQAITLTQLSS